MATEETRNPRVYLAGKIGKNDWRTELVNPELDLGRLVNGDCFDGFGTMKTLPEKWPIIEKGVLGKFDYTGPFFVGCDHACYHGKHTHGTTDKIEQSQLVRDANGEPVDDPALSGHGYLYTAVSPLSLEQSEFREKIVSLCKQAIKDSDFVFAWIESEDAYGTLAELGYAHALGKPIFIAGQSAIPDWWFVCQGMCDAFWFHKEATPSLALYILFQAHTENAYKTIIDACDSPIEKAFMREILKRRIKHQILPQYQVSKYRLDFAIPPLKLAVELDGHDSHKTKEQRTHDAERQRYLERDGWRLIRFTGTEVYHKVEKCVDELEQFVVLVEKERGKPKEPIKFPER